MNLLLFAARRRVYFLNKLKNLQNYSRKFKIFFSDTDSFDPMCHLADGYFLLPPVEQSDFWEQFNYHSKKNQIKAVMAWNDSDILFLSNNRELLERRNIKLCLPPHDYVELFCNKLKTAQWCLEKGINQPQLYSQSALSQLEPAHFPLIAKPIYGQGSLGVRKINSPNNLFPLVPDNLYQKFIDGEEYTVDIWLDASFNPLFIAPRKRLKTRGGEVLISKLEMEPSIINFCENICQHLAFEGVFNIQVMKNKTDIFLIEMNPRIGGGTDLTIEAGANIPLMLINYIFNKNESYPSIKLKDGLMMSRYFENVFI